jgi:hypothetical protein
MPAVRGLFVTQDNHMLGSLALQVIVAIVIFVAGSGTGWTINEWRNGAKIAHLDSNNAVLSAANDKCKTDVESARAGVKQVTDALEAKKQAAEAAMKDAQYWAHKHSKLAEEVNSLPILEGETQCQAIEREQREYVQARVSTSN